ncbi:MAG: alpha amylase C-terminal domain-containing protein [Lachnospiraceae bacterium]|nr:alpha amylase C-terminal domain-containing protein [Lachnospiraceae bacterium]
MRYEISEILKKKLVMDLVYGNNSRPGDILGRHMTDSGQVITAYHPEARQMTLIREDGETYPMDMVERLPVFAIYFPEKEEFQYQIKMHFLDGQDYITSDPYSFEGLITEEEEEQFLQGDWEDAYLKMGSHPMERRGVLGTQFAVWAPNAVRVSVEGDFDFWNGRVYPMQRHEKSGIFEIFIPQAQVGQYYKYKVKTTNGEIMEKSDPYAALGEDREGGASLIWSPQIGLAETVAAVDGQGEDEGIAVYQYEGDPEIKREEILDESFTHILIYMNDRRRRIPVTPYLIDFFGEGPDKLCQVVDAIHKSGKKVIVNLYLNYFAGVSTGLCRFDGTSIYGSRDERVERDKSTSYFQYNYRRGEVQSYIRSALKYYKCLYHVDGFLLRDLTLCHVQEGKYNNLNTERFPEMINGQMHYYTSMTEIIQKMRSQYPDIIFMMSGSRDDFQNEQHMNYLKSFDLLWDNRSFQKILDYSMMKDEDKTAQFYRVTQPLQRSVLARSILTLYDKDDILTYKSAHTTRDQFSMRVHATEDQDILAHVKMTAGFLLGARGGSGWAESVRGIPMFNKYLRTLLAVYSEHRALQDSSPESFRWVNSVDAQSLTLSFIRSTGGEDQLLFIINFSDSIRRNVKVGVPVPGSYRVLIDSDQTKFGGSGLRETSIYHARRQEHDFMPYMIELFLAPQSVVILDIPQGSREEPKEAESKNNSHLD